MPFDPEILNRLLPILASAAGNPQHRASVLQGYLQTKQRLEQEAQQKQILTRQDQLAQAQIGNLQADNQRADRQLQIQQGNADLNRLEHFRTAANQQAGTIAETATDPLAAQNDLAATLVPMAKAYGVKPEAMAGTLPNMGGLISGRKKKRAGELYAQAEKRFGPEAMAGDTITLQSPEFGPIKPSQLRQMFETPAVSNQGTPATPYVKPVVPGTEKERAAQLLGKITDAKTSGDMQTTAKLQREYDNIVKATKDIGLADNSPKVAPRDRYSVQQVTNPDGTVSLVRVDLDSNVATPIGLPGGAAAGKPTDTERLSKAYLVRTEASDKTAAEFEKGLLSLPEQVAARLPTLLQGEAGQRYKQAKDEFINAALRRESGAAIQPSEYVRFDKIYFAVPGDTAATIKQKQQARRRAVEGFRVTAGNLAPSGAEAAPPAAPPAAPAGNRIYYDSNGNPVKR